MTQRTIGRRVAAVACGAVLLLAGCGTGSEDDAPTSSGSTSRPGTATEVSAPGTAAPTEVPTAGESAAPEPAPGGPDATAPDSTDVETPAPPATGAFWDPCTLPESELTTAGLNTASQARISDSTFPTWQMCKWQSADQTFELVIAASDRTMDDLLEPGTYTDLRQSEYYGRQFAQYRDVADTHKMVCHIGTPTEYGSIVFAARNIRVQTDYGNPCDDVTQVSMVLFHSLP